MTETTNSPGVDQLRLFIERLERLGEEKKALGDDIRDVYAEAKATGFDAKAMRRVMRLRKLEPHQRQEEQALLEVYSAALGLSVVGVDEAVSFLEKRHGQGGAPAAEQPG